jgi:phosphoglycolate phosphatase-like HAD superfamily hydrolase
MFALDRAKGMTASHPELAATPAFQAFVRQDVTALAACGKQAVIELLLQLHAHAHAHATEESFALEIATWLVEARHPRFDKPYTALAYQPMRELLAYLAANDFRNFIVTAGGIDMVRMFSSRPTACRASG